VNADTAQESQEAEPKHVEAKVHKPKRKHKKKHYLRRFVIVLAVLCAAFVCAHLSYFNVDGIAIVGNEDITDEEIIKLSGVETGGSVFDVHPLLVQHKIKDNLYIEKVNVNRKLPDKIEIIVQERNLLAQFHKDDSFVITDAEGMVLDISKEAHKATLIEGLTVTAAEKKETIEIKEAWKLEKALDLMKTTEENDLYFKRIVFNGSKVDAYIYDTLKCSGKYDYLMSAITSGTLKKVIYDLYQKNIEKGTVNVYNNDYCFFTPN
jgi:cell division protein FtsQ